MSGQRFPIRGIDDFERALELIGYASDGSNVIDDSSDSDCEIDVGDHPSPIRDEPVQCFSFHLSICDCLCMLIIKAVGLFLATVWDHFG